MSTRTSVSSNIGFPLDLAVRCLMTQLAGIGSAVADIGAVGPQAAQTRSEEIAQRADRPVLTRLCRAGCSQGVQEGQNLSPAFRRYTMQGFDDLPFADLAR